MFSTKDSTYTMNGVEIYEHRLGSGVSILKIGNTMLTQTVDCGIRGTVYSQQQRELVEKALPGLQFTATTDPSGIGEKWNVKSAE